MVYLVFYDIENNRLRTRLAKYLEQLGMRRIQLSVFMGRLDPHLHDLLLTSLRELRQQYESDDSIILLPIAQGELDKMHIQGRDIDFDFVLSRQKVIFV